MTPAGRPPNEEELPLPTSPDRAGGDESRLLTVPNVLSALRLALVPLFVWLFVSKREEAAVVLYGLGASTDWLDGYIARRAWLTIWAGWTNCQERGAARSARIEHALEGGGIGSRDTVYRHEQVAAANTGGTGRAARGDSDDPYRLSRRRQRSWYEAGRLKPETFIAGTGGDQPRSADGECPDDHHESGSGAPEKCPAGSRGALHGAR